MAAARVEYITPWWVYWLHNLPHLELSLQPRSSDFNPTDPGYQQSLLFWALLIAICAAINLLFLTIYLIYFCCCKKHEETEIKKTSSCCVTWTAVISGLLCCAAVGIGFYGNSETNDGIYQLTYSLDNANHTLAGIDSLVSGTSSKMKEGLDQHLLRLSEIFAVKVDYVQSLRIMQRMAGNIIQQLASLPNWQGTSVNLSEIARQTSFIEYYRWLSYLFLFILDLVICFVTCLGLAKRSKCLLIAMLCFGLATLTLSWASLALDTSTAVGTSDFCVAPDKFIMNMTQDQVSAEVVRYYLYCSQSLKNPFQQALTSFQRSLSTMQIQIQGLLQFAVPIFPTAQKDLLGIQLLLNTSESNLHQITALLDCRGLHKDYLEALIGMCYDGVEGLLYLGLFSLMAALAFSAMVCAAPRAWNLLASSDRDYNDIDEEDPFNPQAQRIAVHNPNRAQLRSFCSYSSSLGSQVSLQPPSQTISNAPVAEYMNQAALFGGNPRYENVPLIGRGSPPPTYSPSMRATYLAVSDEPAPIYGNQYPA
ncbi:protein tweety homolog 2 [Spea bombifrons]|uniref:protein tweety homolog 2 n=1 Tax=Spea bombifrons TaxID=233779 RepID=UPI002349321D|nr:protein tweety homolog 2 [Spea bombifrons]